MLSKHAHLHIVPLLLLITTFQNIELSYIHDNSKLSYIHDSFELSYIHGNSIF